MSKNISEELDNLQIRFKEVLMKMFAPGNRIFYKNKSAIIISSEIVEIDKTEELPDGKVEEYTVLEASKIEIKIIKSGQTIEVIEPLNDPYVTLYFKED